MSPVCVRPYAPGDRARVREIACSTGQKGNPTQRYFEDEEVIPILFVDYYLDYEPESCFVAEVDGHIAGYAVGCKDTPRYERILSRRIVPRLLTRLLWKIVALQYRKRQTYQTLWWLISKARNELPPTPVEPYAAHTHLNVETGYRDNRRLGLRLLEAIHQHFRECGIKGMHGVIIEEEGKDDFTAFLQRIYGYRLVATRATTLWESITRTRWYFKVVVRDL